MPTKPKTSETNNSFEHALSAFKRPGLSLATGFGCGLIVAFALNPWDKALYLSVIHQRKFLEIRNFYGPFEGVTQSLFQRAVSHGLYFPLEHFAFSFSSNKLHLSETASSITAGSFAGTINALLLNPVAATKYTRWTSNEKKTFINQLYSMYHRGGTQQFTKGMYATMTRDVIFGSTFAYLRHSRRNKQKKKEQYNSYKKSLFWIDSSSAFVATILSSPFNYVRNIQYSTTNHHRIPSMIYILKRFYVRGMRKGSFANALKYWLFRLRIGWGTARVAVGMSFTSFCYEKTQQYLHEDSE